MTRFEVLTASAYNLSYFLDMVQQDALDAKGCSKKLQLPDSVPPLWESWLTEEAENGVVTLPNGLTIGD